MAEGGGKWQEKFDKATYILLVAALWFFSFSSYVLSSVCLVSFSLCVLYGLVGATVSSLGRNLESKDTPDWKYVSRLVFCLFSLGPSFFIVHRDGRLFMMYRIGLFR